MRAALLLLAVATAEPAVAAPKYVDGEARVSWAYQAKPRIVVRGTVWRCEGELCRGKLIDKPFLTMPTCRAIARRAGWVTAFSTPSAAFGADELARCNGDEH